MIGIQIMFIVFVLISVSCAIISLRANRKKIGYLASTIMITVCNIACVVLLGSKTVGSAKVSLYIYYICYAWLHFCVIWMLSETCRYKRVKFFMIPVALISIYQSVLILSTLSSRKIMIISKHISLGRSWWVADGARLQSVFFGFNTYHFLGYISILIIATASIICSVQSAKIFRGKYHSFMIMQVVIIIVNTAVFFRSLPVWIMCLLMNLICFYGLYLLNYYSDHKLKDWSLLTFANEMSDGFVLYNEYNDLLYMNEFMKQIVTTELLAEFHDIKKLDEWVTQARPLEGLTVLEWNNGSDTFYYKIRKTELDEQGTALGTIYIFHDSTETILKLQAMNEANRELEHAAKMKSDFLANMSHEIRTPMNAVIGMAEIAMREELPPNVMSYLSQIQNSGRNLLNIINDILDFSKIEAGKMDIVPERYEPLSEMNDIANVLATRIGDKKLELFIITDTNIPHALYGDAMRIRQIIINLANNAIKFTKEGMVNIRISCEQIDEEQVMLTYHVTDTGTGIKKEDLKKLFVSFQQVDSKRNRTEEGTGLGLAISQRLCEAMNGTIGVQSEYGKGSDFYFSIPQKVLDDRCDLIVDQAESKNALVLGDNIHLVGMFKKEIERLGVTGDNIRTVQDFRPSGKKDYLFMEEKQYNDECRRFLDANPECIGVVLVAFDSEFVADKKNLRILRRPETTLGMVTILNDKEIVRWSESSAQNFKIDYVAPEAKILIVDDNAINITIAEGLLRPIQCNCYAATGGREAIAMLENSTFDVVLMDHMMPDMDGIETTRIIRQTIPSAADVPIIALTANVLEDVKDMFFNEGMNDFIAKPIDVRDLISKLKYWLPKERIVNVTRVMEASDELPAQAIQYDGLDNEKARKSLGSQEMLDMIVKEYYLSGEERCAKIMEAYTQEDWQNYTIRVHALKSSSRQIGAFEIGDLAEELEKAGVAKDIDTIHEKNDNLLQDFRGLMQKLSKYFTDVEAEESEKQKIDAEELDMFLQKLYVACDNLDGDAMEKIGEELKKYSYPEELQEKMNEIYQAINDMDSDACLELVRGLM